MRLIDADKLILSLNDNFLANSPTGNETLAVQDYRESMCEGLEIAMATVEGAPTVSGWISVKDRLPEENVNQYTQDYQEVLCVLSTRFGSDVRVYKFGKGHFWNGPTEIDRMISHWMPFPEPPKEESND